MRNQTKFSSEFRREAVKLAQSSDKPTKQIAVELGVKSTTLYQWMSRAMKNKTSRVSKAEQKSKHSYQDLESENMRLKKELRRAEMERDILKKAIAIFSEPKAP